MKIKAPQAIRQYLEVLTWTGLGDQAELKFLDVVFIGSKSSAEFGIQVSSREKAVYISM
jgi:hypothetical protein